MLFRARIPAWLNGMNTRWPSIPKHEFNSEYPWFPLAASVRFPENASAKVKVGHGGTLDPMATGVLVIGVGKGCRELSSFLQVMYGNPCIICQVEVQSNPRTEALMGMALI